MTAFLAEGIAKVKDSAEAVNPEYLKINSQEARVVKQREEGEKMRLEMMRLERCEGYIAWGL